MDAFYVSVEMLRHPELRGKPVVVAYDGPRGVVTTASYEARKYGVHSALPMVTARRRCPDLTVLPVDMQLYKRGSVRVMETLREFSDEVEVVGMDEAYVDLSASPVPRSRAQEIKGRIRGTTHLVCSIGLAPNKLMAKIASDLDKPDGFFMLDHDNWLETVGEKPASLLPGVGPKTFERLRASGVETVGQLAAADEQVLAMRIRPKSRSRPESTGERDRQHQAERGHGAEVGEPRDHLPGGRHRSAGPSRDRRAAGPLRLQEPRAERAPRANGDAEDPPAAVQDLHALPHPLHAHVRPGGGRGDRAGAARPLRSTAAGAAGGSRLGRAGGGSSSTTSPAS